MTIPTNLKPKHDQLFRKALENPLVARDFFESHLPDTVKNRVDLASLQIQKESFIEQNLKASISDVLFSVNFGNREGYLYLLTEQQTKPDRFMAFRLLKYMTNIVERHLALNNDAKHLPFVFPLVFYNGKQKYTATINLWDLFEDDDKELAKDTWTKDYALVNLQEIPDEEFKKKTWSGIMEFFLKYASHREFLQKLDYLSENFGKVTEVNLGYDYLELMFSYTLTSINENDKIAFKEAITNSMNKETGERLMTSLAESWYLEGVEKGVEKGVEMGRQEGIEKGVEMGIIKAVISMLGQNLDIKLISSVTGFSFEDIQKLKAKQ